MKKVLWILPFVGLLMTSCAGNTYSKQLQDEKKVIANYIEREKIHVIDTLPAEDFVWGEKDYCRVSGADNMYFHLVHRGDTSRLPIIVNENVIIRYRKYTLTAESDTVIRDWTTLDNPYPTKFKYIVDKTNACAAWHKAVGLMKYTGAECKIICPSKQGFNADQTTVIPYGYDIKIQVER